MAQRYLVMSKSFCTASEKLPKEIKSRIVGIYPKLAAEDKAKGLNMESINGSADPTFRSIRLTGDYRIIISVQPEYDVLLWVDKHDDAYAWAKRRFFNLGQLGQVPELKELDEDPAAAKPAPAPVEASPLFGHISDTELKDLLPLDDAALALLRSYNSEAAFMNDESLLRSRLPHPAFDMLFDLACGESVESVKQCYAGTPEGRKPVPEVFASPGGQSQFYVLESEEDLQMALNYPMEQWRVFLHPRQREVVSRTDSGPSRVTGGAGTGKTVAAMHRAVHLARMLEATNQKTRILFTSFNKSLAGDIQRNLCKIADARLIEKYIEVRNLDSWTARMLRTQGVELRYTFTEDPARLKSLWAQAMTFAKKLPERMSEEELRREWEVVIQGNGVETLQQYYRTSRVGRFVRLGKADKEAIWPVFEEYRALLVGNRLIEPDDAYRMLRGLLEHNPALAEPYAHVIVDEAQDFSNEAFRMIAALVKHREGQPNPLYITGDAHQRIYRRRVVLSHCGINVRGRSRRLRVNYRTTEETRFWAVSVLEGCSVDDLDGGEDPLKGYYSPVHGEKPVVEVFPTEDEEVQALASRLQTLLGQGAAPESICVAFRSTKKRDSYLKKLNDLLTGCPLAILERDVAADAGEIPFATMHRVKGLEFDYMLLPDVSEATFRPHILGKEDSLRERSLLHVASTRARKAVYVSASGELFDWQK